MSDHQPIQWKCTWKVEKYKGSWHPLGLMTPYETVEGKGNLLVIGGASAIWRLIAFSSGVTTKYDSSNAHLGVGDSSTPEADTQTDLQAASNKHYELVDSVTHTDSTSSSSAKTITYLASFETGDANFAWQEWGLFNASGGRMLNRKVASLGTKTSADTWNLTVTISLA